MVLFEVNGASPWPQCLNRSVSGLQKLCKWHGQAPVAGRGSSRRSCRRNPDMYASRCITNFHDHHAQSQQVTKVLRKFMFVTLMLVCASLARAEDVGCTSTTFRIF